jgi:hypothetical protein
MATARHSGLLGLSLTLIGILASPAHGQATNQITDISPAAAEQGSTGLLVTFTLDTDAPPAPPAGILPDSVTIGTLGGTAVTHDSQYTVTALFDIPFDATPGPLDVTVAFTTPMGALQFTLPGGFTVTAGPDTPPTIVQQPQPQTAPPGSVVSFTVIAGGTAPLEYQWQFEQADIPGATEANLTINPVTEPDAGAYRCIVTNDFGTATSSEALLTVAAGVINGYPIVDTAQDTCYDNQAPIACPAVGAPFYGQDAQCLGTPPSYALSGDGLTVYDNVTGLTWTQSPDLNADGIIDVDDKLTFDEALVYADTVLNPQNFGGYDDWRLPTMKELYSLMDFRGTDPDPTATDPSFLTPFINTDFFAFAYGDTDAGERIIDAQFWSSTEYVGLVFGNQAAAFGLNLADGRIKGYPSGTGGPVTKLNYVYFVRGNSDYGINRFVDDGDGTITDQATGLMWMQDDSGVGLNWADALNWAQTANDDNYLGYNDWRVPNAKEMQSIVDYSRAPDATASAAIDPLFNCTPITNLAGQSDYPWYWTGTTHARFDGSGTGGVYICFGRGMGSMDGVNAIDVHGAGCQRSDPKDGDPDDYPVITDAPQGDVQRVFNYVRLVRDADLAQPYAGYNLFAPLGDTTTYLIDNSANVIRSWASDYTPGNSVYLRSTGHLLRTGAVGNSTFPTGGGGGIVQEFSWCGDLLWEFEHSTDQYVLHHDIEPMPSGNVLMIAWELKTQAEALATGRDPGLLGTSGLYPDKIIEVRPTGPNSGEIVWQWHVWDHLVQDYDAARPNFGVVADHPELIDLNHADGPNPSWSHVNSVDYNADLDQILLSARGFSEFWIIDHSTTTAEAAGHTGGNSGMGGDLLYRWGNPATYAAGSANDQQLFVQHDAHWIAADLPGAGNILVFNNGDGRPDGDYSSVDEITPPVNPDGTYTLVPGAAYGPAAPVWSYIADPPASFYADHISGAQRLANGNTLICDGPSGHVFEVTNAGDVIWEYTHGGGPATQIFRCERYGLDFPGFFDPVDLNRDGVVDGLDVEFLTNCLTGPAILITPDCTATDFDRDTDTDLHDVAAIQTHLGQWTWLCD